LEWGAKTRSSPNRSWWKAEWKEHYSEYLSLEIHEEITADMVLLSGGGSSFPF